jgi:uncharacterized protein YkwD
MKWILSLGLMLGALAAVAAPGDADTCQRAASARFQTCSRACSPTSTFCKYRCYLVSKRLRATCPGAANAAENQVMELTNRERQAAGAGVVTWDLRLGAAAQGHAANMAAQDRADHVLDGKTPAQRITEERYAYSWESENIYWGQGAGFDSPEAAVRWWMGSPGHKANLLDSRVQHIGVGVRPGSNGKWYFSQSFGRP